MFEFEAKNLRVGDEFTADDGETWHVVRDISVRPNVPNTVVFVVTEVWDEMEFDPRELLIVK